MKLEFKHVTKRYSEVAAVREVNCVMEQGIAVAVDGDDQECAGGIVRRDLSDLAVRPESAAPIRSPVKEPGPAATAIASIVFKSNSVIFTISSNIGSSVCECVFL